MFKGSFASVVTILAFSVGSALTPSTVGAQSNTVCVGRIDYPHYSPPSRGGTVLFKVRVSCAAPSNVQVRITATLDYFKAPPGSEPPIGPAPIVASTDESQILLGDGSEVTFYTPREGVATNTGSGWYSGSAQGQIIAPETSNFDIRSTPRVYVSVPE